MCIMSPLTQAEHERQMQAAEQERQEKLQAELDQAAVNAGKVPGRRSRRDSSSDDEGWPPVRYLSVCVHGFHSF